MWDSVQRKVAQCQLWVCSLPEDMNDYRLWSIMYIQCPQYSCNNQWGFLFVCLLVLFSYLSQHLLYPHNKNEWAFSNCILLSIQLCVWRSILLHTSLHLFITNQFSLQAFFEFAGINCNQGFLFFSIKLTFKLKMSFQKIVYYFWLCFTHYENIHMEKKPNSKQTKKLKWEK